MPEVGDLSLQVEKIRSRLLVWYCRNRRNLPWRGESSPYRIWVSEVMLQQTQVATVIPYYRRFLAKFPTLADLAEARLEDVLKAWEGLGYYARARNLHRAAREIMEKHAGCLPENYAALRALPGFGDYTAGAVASIAFGRAVPAIDGNVKRVLARLFALEGDVRRGSAARQLKEIAAALVDPARPGDWTQALIELGAMVCLPQAPQCARCPVKVLCQAHQRGLERQLPAKPASKALPHYQVTAAVIEQGKKILIAQRPLEGMLGGLWEFPGGKQEANETLAECLQREIREELGIEIAVGRPVVTVKHSYTHFKITLHAFYCRLRRGQQPQALEVADWRWVTLAEIDAFPFARTDLKIIAALKKQKARLESDSQK
ncbi:MAG: A/G-specific adenine glycosylase [Anaerolineae bacterium]|nr:A/G-specific adenine glycosylase [Anaerolineae bacterium]